MSMYTDIERSVCNVAAYAVVAHAACAGSPVVVAADVAHVLVAGAVLGAVDMVVVSSGCCCCCSFSAVSTTDRILLLMLASVPLRVVANISSSKSVACPMIMCPSRLWPISSTVPFAAMVSSANTARAKARIIQP